MSASRSFVICVDTGDGMDLELGKAYEVLPDESAAQDQFLRVIDESGEDYLYAASHFVAVDVSEASAEALHTTLRSRSGAAG